MTNPSNMMNSLLSFTLVTALGCATTPPVDERVQPGGVGLEVEVYNPGESGIFPVSSVLVTGPTEAILVDAQFERANAKKVVELIRASGKRLTTVYISHGDPDFYFGVDVVLDAFPDARVLATPATVAHIQSTLDAKISYWGPILGDNAPRRTVVPTVFNEDTLRVDGEPVRIVGLKEDPKHTHLWIPSTRTVAGGVLVYENVHVWMADAKTSAQREQWVSSLRRMTDLNPRQVIPGHYLGRSAMDGSAIGFTRKYIEEFGRQLAETEGSQPLIESMKRAYPNFPNAQDLVLGAKVVTGEMPWP